MADPPCRAAQYIRMSTDAQDLSPTIQSSAIALYAQAHGLTVVETYFDSGRSGLTLAKRPAMKKLLRDVVDEGRTFSVVLVYDISRWGRFQDTDASAYYEYHCRLHGVLVKYVQEPFLESESPFTSVIKGVKRAMAAEYSRELSVKTRAGHVAAMEKGFHLGTLPSIGIDRLAVSKQGGERSLQRGEHKSAQTEHVRWIPGPAEEIALVQRIFELYAAPGVSVERITELLRREGCTTREGRLFSPDVLRAILKCEAFVGDFAWGRGRARPVDAPASRSRGTIDQIISRDLWDAVQVKFKKRKGRHRSREQLLSELDAALQQNPHLRGADLQEHGCARAGTYVKYFGSLASAWKLLGRPKGGQEAQDWAHIALTRAQGWHFANSVASVLTGHGLRCERPGSERGCQLVVINGGLNLRLQSIRREFHYGQLQWCLRKQYRRSEGVDYVLVLRLRDGGSIFDSILFSLADYFKQPTLFGDQVPDGFRVLQAEAEVVEQFRRLGKHSDN